MKTQVWVCEKCGKEIEVGPIETSQYRGITCENCGAVFAVLNSELKITGVSTDAGKTNRSSKMVTKDQLC